MAVKVQIKEKGEKGSIQKDEIMMKIIYILTLISVFSIPLFFGIGKINNIRLSKQILLVFLSFISIFFWFLKSLSESRVEIRKSSVLFFSFLFIFTVLASTIFSVWKWGSFWGWPQKTEESFLTILCFFLSFFVFSHIIDKKNLLHLYTTLAVSGFFIAIIGMLQLYNRFVIPWSFTHNLTFNPVGNMRDWALFLATISPIVLASAFMSKKSGLRVFLLATGILILLALVVINSSWAWIEILIGMIIFLVLGIWKLERNIHKFLFIPALFFSLALIFIFLKIKIPGLPNIPLEVTPSLSASFNVNMQMLKTNLKTWILGWGPGTFKYGWSKFKNPSLNQTIFWNIRFSRGKSAILDRLGSLGISGVVIYLSLITLGMFEGIKNILKISEKEKSSKILLSLGTLSSFLSISLIKFLTSANFCLEYLWWVLLASIIIISVKRTKNFELAPGSKTNFLFSLLGVLVLAGVVFVFYLETTRYFAEIKYTQALQKNNLEEIRALILNAAELNPKQEIFWRDLAGIYLSMAKQEAIKENVPEEQKNGQMSQFIAAAIATAKESTEINQNNVANWQARGEVYREIMGLSKGALEWSLKSYEKALSLEPNNPFILVELGRTYISQASISAEEERSFYLEKAQEYIRQALDLKPDYAQAAYQMALVYDEQGKTEQAIATLESLKEIDLSFVGGYDPFRDTGLAFQLGILYYRNEDLNRAQIELERAISLNPDYSNARYFLGLIYDKRGDKEKAIEQFERIIELNPGNNEVLDILSNLKSGKPAFGIIETIPEELPIEEMPEEK